MKDAQYQSRSFTWLDDVGRDVTYGLRTLTRTPGFTVIAIGTLSFQGTALVSHTATSLSPPPTTGNRSATPPNRSAPPAQTTATGVRLNSTRSADTSQVWPAAR